MRRDGGARSSRNVGDPGSRRVVDAACRRLARRRRRRTPSSTADPQPRRPSPRAIAEHVRDGRRPGHGGPRPDRRGRIRRHDPRDPRPRRARGAPIAVQLPTAGRHNAANALGVAAAALGARRLGRTRSSRGLATFPGVGRRLERKGEARGVVVYDDYGHHPTAIRETLAAVRQREPGRRVWAVYEPLTYPPDRRDARRRSPSVLGDGRRGRDRRHLGRPRPGHDGRVGGRARRAWPRSAGIPALRPDPSRRPPPGSPAGAPGDAVLVMGGGRSYRIGELLLNDWRRR